MTADLPWARIVMVNYNAGALLQHCVDALAIQTETSFEAVIVDNESTDLPITDLKLPDQRFTIIHAGGNIGFAAASNLGARNATSPWLAMLNPDTSPREDWLAELRVATERYPRARMFGSTQLQAGDPERIDGFGDTLSAFGTAWRMGSDGPVSALPSGDCEVFSPCAAAALYDASTFRAAGGFDEDFFCYLEDVDLGFRLRLLGERCVQVRRAEVLHVGSAIAGQFSDFSVFHSYRNRIWLFWKNLPWPLLVVLAPLQLLAIAMASLVRPKPYWRTAMRGVLAGLGGLRSALDERKGIQRRRAVSVWAVARMLDWNPMGRKARMPRPVR